MLALTRFSSTAISRIPVPGGTWQTVSSGSVQVLGRLLWVTTLCSMTLPLLTLASRNGRSKERIPPVLPNERLWSARIPTLFSSSKPLTLSVATLWSTRESNDWPM